MLVCAFFLATSRHALPLVILTGERRKRLDKSLEERTRETNVRIPLRPGQTLEARPAQVQWVPVGANAKARPSPGLKSSGRQRRCPPKSSGRQPRCQPKPSGRQGQRTGQRRAIAYLTAKCTTPTPTPWPIFNASIQPINPTFQRFNSNSSERRWLADWSII